MYKIILIITFFLLTIDAKLLNGIAITVDNTPITLVDIDNTMLNNKISKKDAIALLVEKTLYDNIIKKNHIVVDEYDIQQYMMQLASQNGISLEQLKFAISKKEDIKQFKLNIKKRLTNQKLISIIASGKIPVASNDDLKIYYNNNKDKFKQATTVKLKIYISRDQNILQQVKQNPLLFNNNFQVKDVTLDTRKINNKINYIISSTKEGSFSQIFANNNSYNMFYIIKKLNKQIIDFNIVKNQILQIVMQKREQDYLKNYFDVAKSTANIKILR